MNPIEPYSLSAVSFVIGAITSLIPAWIVYHSYKNHKEEFIKYFMYYFLFYGIGMTLMSLILFIFPKDNFKQAVALLFVMPFLFLAFGYFFMIPASIKFPKLKEAGFYLIITFGILFFVLTVINLRPTQISERGLIGFDAPEYMIGTFKFDVDNLFLLTVSIAWLPAIVIFIYEAIKNKTRSIKIRSTLLASGLIALMVFGQMHDQVKTWQAFLLLDALTGASYFLLLAGVLYKGKPEEGVVKG